MTVPRCPFCNSQGLQPLEIRHAGGFDIIYCGQCGAIHGIIPALKTKVPQKKETPTQAVEPSPPPAPLPTAPPETPPQPARAVKAEVKPVAVAQNPKSAGGDPLPHSMAEVITQVFKDQALNVNRVVAVLQHRGAYHSLGRAPRCRKHDLEMQLHTVPDKYPQAGQKFWSCPKFLDCKQFEPVPDGKKK